MVRAYAGSNFWLELMVRTYAGPIASYSIHGVQDFAKSAITRSNSSRDALSPHEFICLLCCGHLSPEPTFLGGQVGPTC
jgi:hypothetical protein